MLASWGYNYFHQVGEELPRYVLEPLTISLLEPRKCKAGGTFSVLVTDDGLVYQWGTLHNYIYRSITKIEIPVKILNVSAGNNHIACVTADGQVFTWGCGSLGRLGHGNAFDQKQPCRVEYFSVTTRANQVACGGAHTLFMCEDGKVYACGFNRYFQCGQVEPSASSILTPRGVPMIDGGDIASICCGKHHSMILMRDGAVYAWGNATRGRLGHYSFKQNPRKISLPKRIEVFAATNQDNSVYKLEAGVAHNVALTYSGRVLTWGDGLSGQLGHGNLICQRIPKIVEGLRGSVVSDVAAGDLTTFAFNDKDLWAWGIGNGGGGSSPSVAFDEEDLLKIPTKIQVPQTPIVSVCSGGAHSLCVLGSSVTPILEKESTVFSLCRHGHEEQLKSALDEVPDNLLLRDENGNTLLIVACQNNMFSIAKLLVCCGCDPNMQNNRGQTALHYSFTYNFLKIFNFLIQSGADDTILNAEGLTCYEGLSYLK